MKAKQGSIFYLGLLSEFLNYLHTYNELFWIWEQSLNMNSVMLGIQPYTLQGLNEIHTMLSVCLTLTIIQHVEIKYAVFHLRYLINYSENFRFWNLCF